MHNETFAGWQAPKKVKIEGQAEDGDEAGSSKSKSNAAEGDPKEPDTVTGAVKRPIDVVDDTDPDDLKYGKLLGQ